MNTPQSHSLGKFITSLWRTILYVSRRGIIESYCFYYLILSLRPNLRNIFSLLSFSKILLAWIISLIVAFLQLLLSIQISKARSSLVWHVIQADWHVAVLKLSNWFWSSWELQSLFLSLEISLGFSVVISAWSIHVYISTWFMFNPRHLKTFE